MLHFRDYRRQLFYNKSRYCVSCYFSSLHLEKGEMQDTLCTFNGRKTPSRTCLAFGQNLMRKAWHSCDVTNLQGTFGFSAIEQSGSRCLSCAALVFVGSLCWHHAACPRSHGVPYLSGGLSPSDSLIVEFPSSTLLICCPGHVDGRRHPGSSAQWKLALDKKLFM